MTAHFPQLSVRLRHLLASLAIIAPVAAGSLSAQVPATVPAQSAAYPALADVDPVTALGRYLRMLAANPRDLASLTGAGRAALAVGDANAALGFYARAEELAPRNGRIKAGLATALVQLEQPRAALKLFDEAVAFGVPVAEVASDRGLANDLVGDNRRAQADYATALRAGHDDETVRRLALSMAVSGDRAGALAMLAPLLRRRDGGAERARAFVLALTGDQSGAANAVRAAMPGPQATAMTSFMGRLTGLGPAQKALAVNFGYFPSDGRAYTAAELFADARATPLPSSASQIGARDPRRVGRADTPLIPAGEALGPRLASNEPISSAPRRRPGQVEEVPLPRHVLSAPIPGVTMPAIGRRPSGVLRQEPSGAAAGTAGPVAVSSAGSPSEASATSVPALRPNPTAVAGGVTLRSAPAVAPQTSPVPAPAAVSLAARPVAPSAAASTTSLAAAAQPAPGAAVAQALPEVSANAAVATPPHAAASAAAPLATAATSRSVGVPVPPSAVTAGAGVSVPRRVAAASVGASPPPAATTAAIAASAALPGTPAIAVTPAGPALAASPPPVAIAMIDLPPATGRQTTAAAPVVRKSDAEAAPGRAPEVTRATGRRAPVAAKPAEVKKTEEKKAPSAKGVKLAALDSRDKRPLTAKEKAAAAEAELKPEKGAKSAKDGKPAKDAKSARDTRASTPKDSKTAKGADDSKTAVKAKAGTPERYWVQVASGSNKANLDKAWSNVKGKAPGQLAGQTTYTAPWRASNRLLIGPFKTADEAQAKVNALARAGVSGIQFTTRAGTDVEKIATR